MPPSGEQAFIPQIKPVIKQEQLVEIPDVPDKTPVTDKKSGYRFSDAIDWNTVSMSIAADLTTKRQRSPTTRALFHALMGNPLLTEMTNEMFRTSRT